MESGAVVDQRIEETGKVMDPDIAGVVWGRMFIVKMECV